MITKKIKTQLGKDSIFKPLLKGLTPSPLSTETDVYFSLTRSIVSQQLSIKAADTIYGRFLNLFPKKYPHPKQLLQKSEETLRSVGLSRAKANYVGNVATFALAENWKKKDWNELDDQEVKDYLCQIKGVGPWTAEMILLFSLNRPDVFPIKDLVIYQTMIELYGLNAKNKTIYKQLDKIADQWRPYRSVACRYLWEYRDQGLET